MSNKENIVYYSGFWYSSHSPIGVEPYDLIMNERKLFERIKSDLRLLSLIFDIIHIPRSHLLTFHTNTNWSIIRKYLLDNDFAYFVEHNIFLSSTLPYIDEYSDTERILERTKNKGWSKEVDDKFIKSIKEVTAIKIDSAKESKNNVDVFEQYVVALKNKNRKVGNEVEEIKKRSNYKTVPFLHEMFVEELFKNRRIDSQTKENIWRFTNSMYITTGCLELGDDRRISFNPNVEHKNATNDNSGMLRELYSPKFIEILIREELGDSYLVKYLNCDINKLMSFRELENWPDFKSDIFEMFETLTQIEKIRPDEFAAFKGQEKLLSYKKYILGEDKDKVANMVGELLEVATGVYDPVLGKVVKTGKSVIAGKLVKWYSERKISQTLKNYKSFWKNLKSVLDGIE